MNELHERLTERHVLALLHPVVAEAQPVITEHTATAPFQQPFPMPQAPRSVGLRVCRSKRKTTTLDCHL